MKNRITRFILMVAFAIAAVSCSVDTQKIPLSVDRPISPPLDLLPVIPQAQEFHTYTEQEQQQLIQNLIGRYQDTMNNQEIILEIRTDGAYFNNQGPIELGYSYSVIFSLSSEPMLMINNVNIYYIECDPNNPTQTLGFYDALNHEIYFRRLNNNETNHHDEL